jgi:hypothetical protein
MLKGRSVCFPPLDPVDNPHVIRIQAARDVPCAETIPYRHAAELTLDFGNNGWYLLDLTVCQKRSHKVFGKSLNAIRPFRHPLKKL